MFPALLVGVFVAGHVQAEVLVSVIAEGPVIIRETPTDRERLLYVSVETDAAPLADLTLTCEVGETITRRLIDVTQPESWDTLWLPESCPRTFPATLTQGETALWSGTLHVPEAGETVVIPRSPPMRVEDLRPLMLRGTNYLPRRWPWPGIWREATRETFEAEFPVMQRLGMNSFRTFHFFDEEAGLVRRDGALTPLLLSRVATLLDVADAHGLKVVLCLTGSLPYLDEHSTWRRYFRTGIEPFMYDGRILMWDLINEPGGSNGPKANETLSTWIQTMWPELRRLAPNHIPTVGLAWQFDQLFDLGVRPPVGQYHHYSGTIGVQPEGEPPVRNVADDLRRTDAFVDGPFCIGEFGYATVVDDVRADASEERQLEVYEGIFTGADAAVESGVRLVGAYNWTLFHFEPSWMGPGEQAFGIVNLDGSLKPAGVLLKETYHRWRERLRAPWEAAEG